jgi:hypothetical protein
MLPNNVQLVRMLIMQKQKKKTKSWWQFRRRRVKKCAWGKEECSTYVKGWVTIRVWISKVIVQFVWWMSSGNIDIWLFFKVETIGLCTGNGN